MTRQVSNRSVFIFAVLILLTIYGADNVEPLSIDPNPVAVSEGEDPPEPTDPPKIPMIPIEFEVTLTNLTEGVPGEGGQIFSPPILITHGYGFSIGASGEPASAALTALAETGDHVPLFELATKSSGVETIAGFLPPPDGVVLPGESVTAIVLATSEAHYLSLATMLVQTNDGIVLANALPLVDGKGNPQTITMDLIAYDAGTEDNNELATHVPGPPFHGMERAPTEGGVIASHTGIGGTADVGVEFGWTEPVARVTVSVVELDTVEPPSHSNYTFESIEVPGVDFLELTASSDFEDYAGNTLSADGQKTVAFTLIDGVFNTYDFPGSNNTYFYALGNDGTAAGYYEDSDGLHHGVILENGELRQYDFPGAVETFIYVISDATGLLTGDFIDDAGVRRGFSGDLIIEFPGAVATYAGFVGTGDVVMGSYIDAEGVYHVYVRSPDGTMRSIDLPQPVPFEYLYGHGINDAGTYVTRAKVVGGIPRTYVGSVSERGGVKELQFPGSVTTHGWNINQDGSIVGYYDTPDGRRHGFIARPAVVPPAEIEPPVAPTHLFEMALAKGLNMISLPLMPLKPYTARTFAEMLDATVVIRLDTDRQEFVGFTADQSGEGYPIEGGQGYIVNVPGGGTVTFEGTAWSNTIENTAAAPGAELSSTGWAFVVSGDLHETELGASYTVVAKNRRTGEVATRQVTDDDSDFNVVWADLSRQPVIESGDTIEIALIDQSGTIVSGPFRHQVGVEDLQKAYVSLSLTVGDVHPTETLLGQNFPNPFNPETWIPYQLESSADVVLHIYDTSGRIVRTIDLGFKPQGFYMTRSTAAYWDGRNTIGEPVASGVYFYSLNTPDFSATRKMLILK